MIAFFYIHNYDDRLLKFLVKEMDELECQIYWLTLIIILDHYPSLETTSA